MTKHLKLHSFTGETDHDFTGLVANEFLTFDGTNVVSSNTASAGNILFVSSSGDDVTAVKGDILHPYANIYAAKSASTSGDVVYVFPQKLFYDNRNSAGNPYNGLIEDEVNLWKDGVTYYFSPGVEIEFFNQTVSGQIMYLFSPINTTGETCTVLGELEWIGRSQGADSSNGHSTFLWTDNSNGGYTFDAEVKKLTSFATEPIRLTNNFTGTTANVNLKGDEFIHQYLGGQSGAASSEFITCIDGATVNYTSAFNKRTKLPNYGFFLRFIGNFGDSKINIYGDYLLNAGSSATWFLQDFIGVVNANIKDMYYSAPSGGNNPNVISTGVGDFIFNLRGNLIDYSPNSNTGGLFYLVGGGVVNYEGNIFTNTESGVGRYIVTNFGTTTPNILNMKGDINYLGTGTTTQVAFQTNGESVVNYQGNIYGNYAGPIARTYNGTVNINNSNIKSTVDSVEAQIFKNNDTIEGTFRLNNSYVELKNNSAPISDGSYVKALINNSTIINSGSGGTLSNTTSFGDLQILNSTVISDFSGATSIDYTGATTVISSNSTVNTSFDITDLKGNITILTDLIY